jgi:hypothetical protein
VLGARGHAEATECDGRLVKPLSIACTPTLAPLLCINRATYGLTKAGLQVSQHVFYFYYVKIFHVAISMTAVSHALICNKLAMEAALGDAQGYYCGNLIAMSLRYS